MPKQTFYNLSQEKQKKIIDAAKSEFSKNGFYDASINKIIKDAGIPRGSFYQYFETKEDLFLYLFGQCVEVFREDITAQMEQKEIDLFEFYLLIFEVGIKERVEEEWKQFFKTTVINMNMKLFHQLEKFMNEAEFVPPIKDKCFLKKSEVLSKYSEEEQNVIQQLLANTTLLMMGTCLNDMENASAYKRNLEKQIEIIKHGVIR